MRAFVCLCCVLVLRVCAFGCLYVCEGMCVFVFCVFVCECVFFCVIVFEHV